MALAIETHADRHTGGVSLSLWGESDWLNMTGLPLSSHIWSGSTGGRGGCAGRWMAKTQRQSVCLCVEGGMICVLWFWSLHFCGWEGACVCVKGEDRKTTTENVFHEHFLWKILIYCFKNIKVCTKKCFKNIGTHIPCMYTYKFNLLQCTYLLFGICFML